MIEETEILSFKIDTWTPETIPMARLADYMRLVANLYGEQAAVHFRKMKKGSAVLESIVEREAFPKVLSRLQHAKSVVPHTDEISKAFDAIDDMLRRDNAIGSISRPRGGKIIEFPGRREPQPEVITITQPTIVDGTVVRIGGVDETIPLVLQDSEGVVSRCTIRGRERARELAKYLYGSPIRVSGTGKWTRSTDGVWELENLNVSEFEVLDDKPLNGVIDELRGASKDAWNADSLVRWKHDREN